MTGVLGWYDLDNITFYPPWYDAGISQMTKNVKKNKCRPFYQKETKKKKTFFLVFWRVTRICWSPTKTPKIWDTWPLTWNNLETKPVLENHLWTYPKFQSKGWNILKNCDIQDIWKVKPWNLLCFLLLASLGDFVKCSQTVSEKKPWENWGIQPGSQCLDGLSWMANHRTMSGVFASCNNWKEIHPGNLT